MAKILYRHYCGNSTCGDCKQPRCVDYIRAEKLAKEGIGDVKQAVREFSEKVKRKLIKGDCDDEFTEGYNCACDCHAEVINKLVKEVE